MAKKKSDAVCLAELNKDVGYIKERVDKIDRNLEKDYVTKDEFDPIRKIVYGTVTVVLVAVITALLALVIRK